MSALAGEVLFPLAVIAVLILLNGVFVAAEFAIVTAPRTRLAQMAAGGSRLARNVLSVQRDPLRQNRYITTAQIGITVVSLGLGMYGEHVVAEWLFHPLESLGALAEPAAHTLATVLAVVALTYLHVVIGEMVPKTLALQSPEPTALALDRPMGLMEKLFSPVVFVLNGLGNVVVRALGIPPVAQGERLFSPEELELIVEESFEGGLLAPSEQLLIENIFDLRERTVGQVMTPRTRVVGIPLGASPTDAMELLCEMRKTRYPLFDGSLDRVIGILHAKDLIRQFVRNPEELDLRALARPAVFLPEALSLEKVLIRFRAERLQMAIAMDEFGGMAGLVTLEDLVEEVVGEIQDEFDHEIEPIEELDDRRLRVRGDLILDELDQLYDLALIYPEADTVGGLVMSELGRIPIPEDRVEFGGVTFQVESVEGMAVQTVIVHLP